MQERTITHITNLTEKAIVDYALHHAYEDGYAFALWKLPNEDACKVLLSFSPRTIQRDQMLEEMKPGFLFAPFDLDANRYFLDADVIIEFRDGKISQASDSSINWIQGATEQITQGSDKPYYHTNAKARADSTEQNNFFEFVESAVKGIESGQFEKVVPSRTKSIALPENFDPVSAFKKLCIRYPESMISLVSIPEVGTWLGATPEILVEVQDQANFRTVALAGTRPYAEGTDPRDVAWTQKEIEEQALVSRYIVNCFKMIRLREFDEHGPKSVVAGNLMHLKTEYAVDMNATNFPQLGSVMLQLLHPTSAVCGMPMEPSLAFIRQHEKHDRMFYAGFIGPVNIHQKINLFVNLRCMQLLDKKAICYAGAGVTVDSVPSKEWEETEMKLSTLLTVIL